MIIQRLAVSHAKQKIVQIYVNIKLLICVYIHVIKSFAGYIFQKEMQRFLLTASKAIDRPAKRP